MFQFICANYGDRKADRPSAGVRRKAASMLQDSFERHNIVLLTAWAGRAQVVQGSVLLGIRRPLTFKEICKIGRSPSAVDATHIAIEISH